MRTGFVSTEGAGEIRQRVIAALLSLKCSEDRLIMRAGTPEVSAASCNRRDGVSDRIAGHYTLCLALWQLQNEGKG
jgi:hypothetical protein